MPVHLRAWNEALRPYGAKLTHEDHERWAGRPTRSIVELLNQEYGHKMSPDDVMAKKEAIYLQTIHLIAPVRDVRETILAFHGQVPMAVVSGSPRQSVLKTLRHLDLEKYFDLVLGNEDYVRGKPAPDCFLTAAGQLNVEPSRCLVFEDGELGIEGARAAGMKFVRVVPDRDSFDLERSDFT